MTEKSKVTEAVREAIVKAAEAGEGIAVKVTHVTKDAVSEALKKAEPHKEKVEKMASGTLQGLKSAAKESSLVLQNFMRQVIEGLSQKPNSSESEGKSKAEETADKTFGVFQDTGETIRQVAVDVIKGVQEGIREVIETRKQKDKKSAADQTSEAAEKSEP